MKGRISKVALAALFLLTSGLIVVAPAKLINNMPVPEFEGDLADWLEASESRANANVALIPDTAKRIRWYQERRNSKTRYSIVYLHGFSATRQEIAPVGAMIADALGANLFETRLAGHGQQQNALQGVRAEDWIKDAVEALSIGAIIGEQDGPDVTELRRAGRQGRIPDLARRPPTGFPGCRPDTKLDATK